MIEAHLKLFDAVNRVSGLENSTLIKS